MIDGVQVVPLPPIADERGAVYHMLKETDPHFLRFGEIYFSMVYPGVVKAWKNHTRLTANYACVFGRIKLVLFDDRTGSSTHGAVTELYIGPEEYALVVIPPGIWHGVQNMLPASFSSFVNLFDRPYEHDDPDEWRLPVRNNQIPYDFTAG